MLLNLFWACLNEFKEKINKSKILQTQIQTYSDTRILQININFGIFKNVYFLQKSSMKELK